MSTSIRGEDKPNPDKTEELSQELDELKKKVERLESQIENQDKEF